MRTLTLAILMFAATLLSAQFSVEGSVDRNRIGVDDMLTLSIEISGKDAGKVPQPKLPDIPGFTPQGSNSSSSSSMSIINGVMETKSSIRYDFYLKPRKEGKYTIPPVMVSYKGATGGTRAINVEVVPGSLGRQRRSDPFADPFADPFGAPTARGGSRQQAEPSDQDAYISVEVDKKSVYQGEAITATYRLNTVLNPRGLSFGQPPEYDGFWKDEQYRISRLEPERVRRNGRTYYTQALLTLVLTPNRSGTLQIPSLPVNLQYLQQAGFFGFAGTGNVELHSPSQTVQVKPLPTTGRPAGFSGAVGSFEVSAELAPQKMRVGDAFTCTLHIRGKAAMPYLVAPTPPIATQVRFLDPEITSRSGEKTIKYAGIAQEEGSFTLPPFEFSYFDPARGQYVTKQTPEFSLKIDPGIGGGPVIGQTVPGASAQDIAPILTQPALGRFCPVPESPLFWILFLLAGLTIPLALRRGRRLEMLAGDTGYRREQAADRILRRYLNLAAGAVETTEFHPAAQTGLSNYLCDKLRIPRGVRTEELLEALREARFPETLVEKAGLFFHRCHEARFMPGGFTPEGAREDYLLLKALVAEVSTLRKPSRKRIPGISAMLLILFASGALFATDGRQTLWQDGVRAYAAGDYATALDRFGKIELAGVRDPGLYLNLGNANYRSGRIGQAVLYYKKALRIAPNDRAARQSLAFAMTRTLEAQSPEPADAMMRFLHRLYFAVPLNLMAWLWLFFLIATIGWLDLILIRYRNRERTLPLFVLTVLIAVWTIWGALTVMRWVEYRNPGEAVVTAASVTGAPAPGQDAVVFTLHEGYVVRVTASDKSWTRIKLPNGLVGWVPSASLTSVR